MSAVVPAPGTVPGGLAAVPLLAPAPRRPVEGPALRPVLRPVLQELRGAQRRGQVLALFDAAVAADPHYQPSVTAGEPLTAWFDRKGVDWSCLATLAGHPVGYVAARRSHRLPAAPPAPRDRDWEMCRLVVHPQVRRSGIATDLVQATMGRYGARLWATCQTGGASHRLFEGLGWTPHCPVTFADDPAPGIALFAPAATGGAR